MAFPQEVWFGAPGPISATAPSGTVFALNQSTDVLSFIFQAPEAITITRVAIVLPSTSPNGTGTTWIAGLQGVDATNGQPNGTFLGGGTPASVTFTNSGLSTSNTNWLTLANSYTCTRGQAMAMVVQYSSGTTPSSGTQDLTLLTSTSWAPNMGLPYAITNDNGSVSKVNTSPPAFGIGSSTQAYMFPYKGAFNTAFQVGSNPDEYAIRFKVPDSWCSTYKVSGLRFCGQAPTAGTNNTLVRLYDTDGSTVLATFDWDTEIAQSNTTTRLFNLGFTDTTLPTLTAGSVYRVGFAPQTSGTLTVRGITFTSAADGAAYDNGDEVYSSSRTNEGAWTDDQTMRILGEILLTDLTEPAGGSVAIPVSGRMVAT